jgi:hypothetical protein
MSFGHWFTSTNPDSFNERMRIDANGNTRIYDGYFAVGSSDNFRVENAGSATMVGNLTIKKGSPAVAFQNASGTALGSITHDGTTFVINDDVELTNSGGLTTATAIVSGTSIYAGGTGGTGNVYASNLLMGDDPGTANTANVTGLGLYGGNTSGYIVVSRYAAAATDSGIEVRSDYWTTGSPAALASWRGIQFGRMLTSTGVYQDTGYIQVPTTTTANLSLQAGSDHRMKDNIRTASEHMDILGIIDSLRVVLFDNNQDGPIEDRMNQLGYIAHEVQAHRAFARVVQRRSAHLGRGARIAASYVLSAALPRPGPRSAYRG